MVARLSSHPPLRDAPTPPRLASTNRQPSTPPVPGPETTTGPRRSGRRVPKSSVSVPLGSREEETANDLPEHSTGTRDIGGP